MSALTAPTVFLAPRHPLLKASMCLKYAEDFPALTSNSSAEA